MYARTFNIHLPSNTPGSLDNRTNRFSIRLPKKLEFNSTWLVGLSVINYPHTWTTIDRQLLIVRTQSGEERYDIPSRSLNTPRELIEFVQQCIKDKNNQEDLSFDYDEINGRFSLSFGKNTISVELSEQLAYITGFIQRVIKNSPSRAQYEPDLSGGLSLLYIYAPGLIEPVTIGNTTAPLLRIVNVKGYRNRLIEQIYDTVEYHRLLAKEINEISIEIRTHTGELVPFQYGNCLLTLSFRKAPLL